LDFKQKEFLCTKRDRGREGERGRERKNKKGERE